MASALERSRAALAVVASAFAAGAFGGLCIGVLVPALCSLGLSDALGVAIHPALTKEFLYSKIVWGGLWGPIMLAPVSKSPLLRGSLLGAAGPGLVQLLVVFPLLETPGSFGGLTLGALCPLLILFFNSVIWGFPTASLFAFISAKPATPYARLEMTTVD